MRIFFCLRSNLIHSVSLQTLAESSLTSPSPPPLPPHHFTFSASPCRHPSSLFSPSREHTHRREHSLTVASAHLTVATKLPTVATKLPTVMRLKIRDME